MADPKFPYVKWRDGRPRSSHGVYARALGFVDADLRHPPHDENGRPVGACISAILYRPQTREAAAKMRAEIRAAKLLGVAEPARDRDRHAIVNRQAGTPSVL